MNVLFVCTGNTCRSSMARVLAEKEFARAGTVDITVCSAGTGAAAGSPATENAVAAMREKGIDLTGHRAALLDRRKVEEAGLILTMTAVHRDAVIALYPDAASRTYTLGGYTGSDGDVEDPYGGSMEAYLATAGQLERLIRLAAARILQEMQEGNGEDCRK